MGGLSVEPEQWRRIRVLGQCTVDGLIVYVEPSGDAGARDLANDASRLRRNGWRCRRSPLIADSEALSASSPDGEEAVLRAGGLRA
jgi:hypothetical protein